jgi:hypothetical protein
MVGDGASSVSLHACAHSFLKTWPFMAQLASFGEIQFSGSYALDTMTWPDIDLSLDPFASTLTHGDILAELTRGLFGDTRVRKVDYRNFIHHPKSGMTQGMYLGADVLDEGLKPFGHGVYWKVDLWILKDPGPSRLFLESLRAHMTPAHKDRIMAYKAAWTKAWGHPPQMASYFLYQAVVFEGLSTEEEILPYLRTKGVTI